MIAAVAVFLAASHAPSRVARGAPRASRSAVAASALAPTAGRSMLQVRIAGIGSAAPDATVSNADLESVVETSDEWITKRTGITKRHLLSSDGSISDLAIAAANHALKHAGIAAEDIDLIVLATSSPDDLFGDAAYVGSQVGATKAVAFDLTAACSGFLFGVVTASQFLHTGAYKHALVIGADALSRWVDWDDRNTCILFGDGAGAVVMSATGAAGGDASGCGVLGFEMRSDGSGRCQLNLGYTGEPRALSAAAGAPRRAAPRARRAAPRRHAAAGTAGRAPVRGRPAAASRGRGARRAHRPPRARPPQAPSPRGRTGASR